MGPPPARSFPGPLGVSLAGKALEAGTWRLEVRNIREHGIGTHRAVDDTPAGGGPGMVMRADVVAASIDAVLGPGDPRPRLLMSARGRRLDQAMVRELAEGPGALLVCGRSEGVDEGVIGAPNLREVPIGDSVLSGGGIAAIGLTDACVRLLPGVMGAAASLLVILIDLVVPYFHLAATLTAYLAQIDFHEALIDGMLSFLLFAGALHVKLDELLDLKWVIGTLAVVGTILSSLITGALGYWLFDLVGLPLPFLYCLLFGALISPTDPIAVMGVLRQARLPKALEMKIVGESLFNDGVGVVIFLVLIAIQYVVINHGAVRISEVTARFTLDAMPGKQMSIDSDLNAGLIDEAEARSRRRQLSSEAEFYGAMDGASRFTQRDAVASILITAINILAGFLIGVLQHGMELKRALATYTVLTIGDGLVATKASAEIVERFQTGSAYGWTLGFGIAAIQLFGSDFLDMQDAPPSEAATPALRRIWPVRPRATWPPPIRLNDAIGDLPQLPRAFFSRLPD